jgi:glycerate kinase
LKIIIAPDKLRGSLTSGEATQVISQAVSQVYPNAQLVLLPLADGGEGTLESIAAHLPTREVTTTASDPFFQPVSCVYRIHQHTAYIEMAQASGLWRVPEADRNPKYTTTLGTGELVRHAIEMGCTEIYLGIGGSATNDAGMGFAHALGYRFLNRYGNELKPYGASLAMVEHIEPPKEPLLRNVRLWIASDVNNPLAGPLGATNVYGPQKGASVGIASELEIGMIHFAEVIKGVFGTDFSTLPGAGAAGGLGFGAVVFGGGTLLSGIEYVLQISGIDEHLSSSQLVLTAEGKIDSQSFSGKVLEGLLKRCTRYQVPLWSFAGKVEYTEVHPYLALHEFGALAPSTSESMRNAANYLKACVKSALATHKATATA